MAPIVWPGFRPQSARMSVSAGERSRGCAGQARRSGRGRARRGRRRSRHSPSLHCRRAASACLPGSDDQQRFLEARIVAGEIGDVGRMLAVAIDDEGRRSRLRAACQQRLDARLVGRVAARPASLSARRIRASATFFSATDATGMRIPRMLRRTACPRGRAVPESGLALANVQ